MFEGWEEENNTEKEKSEKVIRTDRRKKGEASGEIKGVRVGGTR